MKRQSRRSFLKTTIAMSSIFIYGSNKIAFASPNITQPPPPDEDGHRAWLRYNKIENTLLRTSLSCKFINVVMNSDSETANIICKELTGALSSMLDKPLPRQSKFTNGSIIIGTNKSAIVKDLLPHELFEDSGTDGFVVRSLRLTGIDSVNLDTNALTDAGDLTSRKSASVAVTVIASQTEVGCLYGAFAFLKMLQTESLTFPICLREKPKNLLRILAHSDNLDGSVDRGYQGKSLWHWKDLPQTVNPRLDDYARLNASLGLNGVVLNAVDADPQFLSAENIIKLAALAEKFRPYGLKTYLSISFTAPQQLGILPTADPLDKSVIAWWQEKAREIYKLVPDFGGYLVKANSENAAGPLDYGRTHADGANMLGSSLAAHGGLVMWRAFVYAKDEDPDRVKRSYREFKPLDGKFADNVLLQVKNGPLDFQPREPFHPLFGAMPKTRLVGELQINQEYLGQGTHLVFLASMWKEVLSSNTYASESNPSVAQVIEQYPHSLKGGFSATSNVGDDSNWCGHHLSQANWFAYGRLTWNTDLTPESIAKEWTQMTWSTDLKTVDSIHEIMMASYEAYVSYSMPLGLHHLVGGDHYAPMPEGYGDPNGMFHHAARNGIGYDRTRTTGSDAVDQYHAPLNDLFNDINRCPEKLLLWFHHVPWDRRMRSGRTLWQELCFKYYGGAQTAHRMERQWAALKGKIDSQRHEAVAAKFRTQSQDADHWASKCLVYFSQFSQLPIDHQQRTPLL